MKLNWTRKGRQRLQQVYDYIAEDQPANALHFINQITQRVQLLADSVRKKQGQSQWTAPGTHNIP